LDEDTLHDIMMAHIIMHKMIIEDECEEHIGGYEYHFDDEGKYV
jgi:hypothetical protein